MKSLASFNAVIVTVGNELCHYATVNHFGSYAKYFYGDSSELLVLVNCYFVICSFYSLQ